MTELSVKRGDSKKLTLDLARDLTGVTAARVIIAEKPGATPVIDRAGVIASPATSGIVTLQLTATDYGTGKLEIGADGQSARRYRLEVETSSASGLLTHPDDDRNPYLFLVVVPDLG